jgi:hypothetical protein
MRASLPGLADVANQSAARRAAKLNHPRKDSCLSRIASFPSDVIPKAKRSFAATLTGS